MEYFQISDESLKQAKRAMIILTWRGVQMNKFTTHRSRLICDAVLLANSCFQKCVTAAENKISAIDGKALGMNFQLGSLYDAR